MTMKHNKKRNTAFLYECLIKEMTKAIVRGKLQKKQQIVETLKRYFSKGTPLYNDLQLYKQLMETNGNFVPNYKNIATIGQHFNSEGLKPKTRLLIEERLKRLVISQSEAIKEDKMKTLDSLTYNTFVNKFNDSYKHSLLKEQRDLLTNYIVSFSDNGLGLKMFMNEELGRLKIECEKLTESKWTEKIILVKEKVESYKSKPLTEDIVREVFYIQDLLAELNKNV